MKQYERFMMDDFMTRELEKRLESALGRLGYPAPKEGDKLLAAFTTIAEALEDCVDRLAKAGLLKGRNSNE